jgi:predicted DNA-binding transcriptional regulator AlpA
VNLLAFEELKPKKGIDYVRDHVRRLGQQGKFPKPIRLGGGRRIAFIESEIDDYLEAQRAARDAA